MNKSSWLTDARIWLDWLEYPRYLRSISFERTSYKRTRESFDVIKTWENSVRFRSLANWFAYPRIVGIHGFNSGDFVRLRTFFSRSMTSTSIFIADVHHRLHREKAEKVLGAVNICSTYVVLQRIVVEQKSTIESADAHFSAFVTEVNGGDEIGLGCRDQGRCLSRNQSPIDDTFIRNIPQANMPKQRRSWACRRHRSRWISSELHKRKYGLLILISWRVSKVLIVHIISRQE